MIHKKIYQVSKKGETNSRNIHYVNADNATQAVSVARQIWSNVSVAHDVSDKWTDTLKSGNLPDYVIKASDWI